jgi:hypothetical protein
MSIAEEVLVPQLNIFIAGRYEEAEKNIQREMARASISDIGKEEGGKNDGQAQTSPE